MDDPIPNASQAYSAARAKVDSRALQLAELLGAHEARQVIWPGDWGLVGDLDRVAAFLDQAIACVSTSEPPAQD